MRETKAEIEAEEVALRCEVQFQREHGRAKQRNPRTIPKKDNPHKNKLPEGGSFWGRRARDSAMQKISRTAAAGIVKRPAYSLSKPPRDWLGVWWLPPKYKKWHVEHGFGIPIWDWGLGSQLEQFEARYTAKWSENNPSSSNNPHKKTSSTKNNNPHRTSSAALRGRQKMHLTDTLLREISKVEYLRERGELTAEQTATLARAQEFATPARLPDASITELKLQLIALRRIVRKVRPTRRARGVTKPKPKKRGYKLIKSKNGPPSFTVLDPQGSTVGQVTKPWGQKRWFYQPWLRDPGDPVHATKDSAAAALMRRHPLPPLPKPKNPGNPKAKDNPHTKSSRKPKRRRVRNEELRVGDVVDVLGPKLIQAIRPYEGAHSDIMLAVVTATPGIGFSLDRGGYTVVIGPRGRKPRKKKTSSKTAKKAA